MPFYIGDYLKRTMHLTTEQHGIYLLLIMACWCNSGLLPSDDLQLSAIVRLPVAKWRAMKAVIAPFFSITDDGWQNKRVTEELANSVTITNERSEAGKRGAKARWNRLQTDDKQ